MGTIKQEAQRVSFSANEAVRSATDMAKSRFNSAISGLSAQFGGIINGDVVGIDVNHVPAMKQEINTYIEDLKEHLNTMKSNASTSNAFKGEYATAVTEFVNAIEIACGYVIDTLSNFNTQLDEVAEKYQAKDSEMASDIRNQADELKQN